MIPAATSPIIFFDGECNLCNGFVQFIIRHDKKKIFLFAPLQSNFGKEAIGKMSLLHKPFPETVIFSYNGKWYLQSSAALFIFKQLGWPWACLFAGIVLPAFLRDGAYNLIARNRYKWFGKQDVCMVPGPDITDRFLTK